jgi:hypothetical protein
MCLIWPYLWPYVDNDNGGVGPNQVHEKQGKSGYFDPLFALIDRFSGSKSALWQDV